MKIPMSFALLLLACSAPDPAPVPVVEALQLGSRQAAMTDAVELRRFRFGLDANQTHPINSFGGKGSALARWNPDTRTLSLEISHDLQDARSAQIHAGAPGENGPMVYAFDSATSPIRADWTLTEAEQRELASGNLYVDIATEQAPGGQIRGQIAHAPPGVTRYVTITNRTEAQIFSRPVVISHAANYRLFELGQLAPGPLVELAEEGRSTPLRISALDEPAVLDVVVAPDMLAPGASTTLAIRTDAEHPFVSSAAMLSSTNDGFFAIRDVLVPLPGKDVDVAAAGPDYRMSVQAYGYDAGSEANTEDCDHIPGPPCDGSGVRVVAGAERRVYVHSGIHGIGDLAEDLDWQGAVADVAIAVRPPDVGQVVQPLNLDTPLEGVFVIQEPSMCEGSATITWTYSKQADFVYADLDMEGIPYRLSVVRPDRDPKLTPLSVESNEYNSHQDSVDDGVWQINMSGFNFNKTSTFWYGPDGILLGNEHDLAVSDLPAGAVSRDYPVLQMICSTQYEGTPDGRVKLRLKFAYRQMLDYRKKAGFLITILPRNLNDETDTVVYNSLEGLPLEEAFSWDDALELMNLEAPQSFFASNTLESHPKPDFLRSRPNRMPGFRGTIPPSPLSDVWYREGCGTRVVGSGPAAAPDEQGP
jgi:hypothetical protein